MNITEIRNTKVSNLDYQKFIPNSLEQAKTNDVSQNKQNYIVDKNDVKIPINWQQDILAQGLEMLENKIQVDNNSTTYVLDRPENAPIETFEQAVQELKLLNTELFVKQALDAQANIPHKVVFDLLMEIS
jgi:hypothetical protein